MVGNAWQRISAVVMCTALVAVGACGGGNEASTDSAATSTATGDVARDTAAAATAPGAAATTPSAGTSSMSITGGDPEILQVLATVDQGEIADGQMAQRMARSSQVKSYARELVASHTKSLAQDRRLAKTANVTLNTMGGTGTTDSAQKAGATASATTPSTSGSTGNVATQLQTMHQQTSERLKSLKGADFDSAFVNAQVMGHQQVLALLQSAGSQAQNSDISQHLATATKEVQEHLDRAQKLQQSLTSGSTGTADSASKSRSDTARRGS
jgi:putative membrane protein